MSRGEPRAGKGLLEVQLESEGAAPEANGDPVFSAAGTEGLGDYRCAECGYGITVRRILPQCPMCRGVAWEEPSTSPFGRSRVRSSV
jgi:rubrerythrin